MSRVRLVKELKEASQHPNPDIDLEIIGGSFEHWVAVIRPPKTDRAYGGINNCVAYQYILYTNSCSQ